MGILSKSVNDDNCVRARVCPSGFSFRVRVCSKSVVVQNRSVEA